MKQLSNKFGGKKSIRLFETFFTDTEIESTTRKIYGEDYELLKRMAQFKDSKILHLLYDIYLDVEPICLENEYEKLPKVYRPAYVVEKHKSVRIPIQVLEFLEENAEVFDVNMKSFLGSCIRYYANNHMPQQFFELMQFENEKNLDLFKFK